MSDQPTSAVGSFAWLTTATLDELRNHYVDVATDLEWHQRVLDGTWPQAVEILERALAAAKARASHTAPEAE